MGRHYEGNRRYNGPAPHTDDTYTPPASSVASNDQITQAFLSEAFSVALTAIESVATTAAVSDSRRASAVRPATHAWVVLSGVVFADYCKRSFVVGGGSSDFGLARSWVRRRRFGIGFEGSEGVGRYCRSGGSIRV